jgi:hypothetical protein
MLRSRAGYRSARPIISRSSHSACNARPVHTDVPNTRRSRLYANDRLIIAVEVRELNRSCTLPSSAPNAFIDERIEPLSPDKLRGIVPLNTRAGAA